MLSVPTSPSVPTAERLLRLAFQTQACWSALPPAHSCRKSPGTRGWGSAGWWGARAGPAGRPGQLCLLSSLVGVSGTGFSVWMQPGALCSPRLCASWSEPPSASTAASLWPRPCRSVSRLERPSCRVAARSAGSDPVANTSGSLSLPDANRQGAHWGSAPPPGVKVTGRRLCVPGQRGEHPFPDSPAPRHRAQRSSLGRTRPRGKGEHVRCSRGRHPVWLSGHPVRVPGGGAADMTPVCFGRGANAVTQEGREQTCPRARFLPGRPQGFVGWSPGAHGVTSGERPAAPRTPQLHARCPDPWASVS